MKSIIFLNQGSFADYNINALFSNKNYRYVLLNDDAYTTAHPQKVLRRFDKIYTLKHVKFKDGQVYDKQALDAFCRVIETEINRASKENVRLVCAGEYNILLSGLLRDRFNLPGPTYQQLLCYRDKIAMKCQLLRQHIRVPKFTQIDLSQPHDELKVSFKQVCASLGLPFIVKPSQGASSIATRKINTFADLIAARTLSQAGLTDFEAEEFIEGTLYHVDSLVQNGKVLFAACSEYLFPNLTYFSGVTLATIPLSPKCPHVDKLLDFNQKALTALGLINGATHMEVFITQREELVFLEVGARPPGSPVVPSYERQYGINLFNLHIKAQISESINLPVLAEKTHVFAGYFPLIQGKVTHICDLPLRSHYTVDWKIKVGDIIEQPSRNFLEYAAVLNVENKDFDILRQDFEKLRDFVPYEVVS